MADRYFVGTGARNWNDTANWSATSGGSGGESIPTSSDNVFFDANSGTGTVTVNAEANMLNLTFDSGISALTLSNAVFNFNVYGSLTLPSANLTISFSGTGYLYFRATTTGNTITSGGVARSWNSVLFNGIGGEWLLQDLFNPTARIALFNGTFDLNNQNVTCGTFAVETGIKTLKLTSSLIYCGQFSLYHNTNLTFDAGTSTINTSGLNFYTRGYTFYDIIWRGDSNINIESFTAVSLVLNGGPNNARVDANITINNTLTISGTNGTTSRLLIYSNTLGTPRTITVNGTITATNCDFRDITFAGTASPVDVSTQEIGDCGGNSGITFRPAENRYYKATSTSTHYFDESKWFSETNGGGDSKTMPLPQDTAIFDANSFSGTTTLNIRNARIGSLDMSGVDKTVTLTLANAIGCYGNHILGSTVATTTSNSRTLLGRKANYILNLYGRAIGELSLQSFEGTYVNQSTFTCHVFYWAYGTFDSGGYDITTSRIQDNASPSRLVTKIYLRTSTLTLTQSSGNPWDYYDTAEVVLEDYTLKFTGASLAEPVMSTRGRQYNRIWITGPTAGGVLRVGAGGTFNEIIIDPSKVIKFIANYTYSVGNLIAIGTPSSPITITSATAAQHTLAKSGTGLVNVFYCNISYSAASPSGVFYASDSIDSGGNTGWNFGDILSLSLNDSSSANDVPVSSANVLREDVVSLLDDFYKREGKSLSDVVSVSDAIDNIVGYLSLDDLLTLNDALYKLVSREFHDVYSASDSTSLAATFNVTLLDYASITEVLVKSIEKLLSDNIIISDVLNNRILKFISDVGTLYDSIVSKDVNKRFSDSVRPIERLYKDTIIPLVDAVSLNDTYILRPNKIIGDIVLTGDELSYEKIRKVQRKYISLTDPEYFCNKSWTLSYNMNTQKWISFHTYLPNWYIGENNFYYSGLNDCCGDFEFVAGAIPSEYDCRLWGYVLGEGAEIDCEIEAECTDCTSDFTTTTTSTSSTSTSTTTSTTTLYGPCDLDGEIIEIVDEPTTTTTSTTICVRPSDLEALVFITGFTNTGTGVTVDSTLNEIVACDVMHFLQVTPDPDIMPTYIFVETYGVYIGSHVYLVNGTDDCQCIPDGWYFTDETSTYGYVFHVESCIITEMYSCDPTTSTSTTSTSTTEYPYDCELDGEVIETHTTTTTSTTAEPTTTTTTTICYLEVILVSPTTTTTSTTECPIDADLIDVLCETTTSTTSSSTTTTSTTVEPTTTTTTSSSSSTTSTTTVEPTTTTTTTEEGTTTTTTTVEPTTTTTSTTEEATTTTTTSSSTTTTTTTVAGCAECDLYFGTTTSTTTTTP